MKRVIQSWTTQLGGWFNSFSPRHFLSEGHGLQIAIFSCSNYTLTREFQEETKAELVAGCVQLYSAVQKRSAVVVVVVVIRIYRVINFNICCALFLSQNHKSNTNMNFILLNQIESCLTCWCFFQHPVSQQPLQLSKQPVSKTT